MGREICCSRVPGARVRTRGVDPSSEPSWKLISVRVLSEGFRKSKERGARGWGGGGSRLHSVIGHTFSRRGRGRPCSGRPARMSPATERAPNPARETCLSRRNARRVRAPGRGLDSRNNAGLTAVNSFCLCRGACLQVILLFGGKRRVRFFPTEIEVGN